jgi:hypothetical protein
MYYGGSVLFTRERGCDLALLSSYVQVGIFLGLHKLKWLSEALR